MPPHPAHDHTLARFPAHPALWPAPIGVVYHWGCVMPCFHCDLPTSPLDRLWVISLLEGRHPVCPGCAGWTVLYLLAAGDQPMLVREQVA
jgi:hypothetical protein